VSKSDQDKSMSSSTDSKKTEQSSRLHMTEDCIELLHVKTLTLNTSTLSNPHSLTLSLTSDTLPDMVLKSDSGIPGRKVDLQIQILQDDGLEVPFNESKFDRQNAICMEVLSLNKYRVNERVGRSRNPQGLQDHIRKCSDVRESGVSEDLKE